MKHEKPRDDDATPRRIMTATEVAEYVKVNRDTIYELAGKGQIPFFRIGIHLRFRRDAIEKWMTDRTSEALKKSGVVIGIAKTCTTTCWYLN